MKFLLTRDKFILEMRLKQSALLSKLGYTYIGCLDLLRKARIVNHLQKKRKYSKIKRYKKFKIYLQIFAKQRLFSA